MKLIIVVGTRPEAIKMAPVVRRLREEPGCTVLLCATAQHREMLDQVLSLFALRPAGDCREPGAETQSREVPLVSPRESSGSP